MLIALLQNTGDPESSNSAVKRVASDRKCNILIPPYSVEADSPMEVGADC